MHEGASTKAPITFDDFRKIDIRVGKIIAAKNNERAKKPAYQLSIDFGPLGIKTSSAQITKNYSADDLVGKFIVGVVNFPPKNIAGVVSEVLVLGADHPIQGVILLELNLDTELGTQIA